MELCVKGEVRASVVQKGAQESFMKTKKPKHGARTPSRGDLGLHDSQIKQKTGGGGAGTGKIPPGALPHRRSWRLVTLSAP